MIVVLIIICFVAWIGLALKDGAAIGRKRLRADDLDELNRELYFLDEDPHLLEDDE